MKPWMSLPVVALLLVFAQAVYAQTTLPHYVVIGAFTLREHADGLSQKARGQIDVNPAKHLYYVFVMKTDDNHEALAEALRLRKEGVYKDAWVFTGELGEHLPKAEKPEDIIVPVVMQTAPVVVEEKAPEPPKQDEQDVKIKDFFFNVITADGSKVEGAEIAVIDPKSQRKEYILKGNENFSLKAINQSGEIRLEADHAGYRKTVQTINFKSPTSTEGVTIQDNRVIVPFSMVRLQAGDNAILYNVFFYKDAAIMRPESKFDLDGLLAMMTENPKYKIRIHGHTNGNAAGKILEAGEGGDLFSLKGAKEGKGSAKKLSEKRAAAIRDYLAKQGIAADRMQVKAWGGKKPLYDKLHTQASANVRVEVEVLED